MMSSSELDGGFSGDQSTGVLCRAAGWREHAELDQEVVVAVLDEVRGPLGQVVAPAGRDLRLLTIDFDDATSSHMHSITD